MLKKNSHANFQNDWLLYKWPVKSWKSWISNFGGLSASQLLSNHAENLQVNFFLHFKTFLFSCPRKKTAIKRPRLPHPADAVADVFKPETKKFLNVKKNPHANFQHDCFTNGPLRACQSLHFTKDVPKKFGESSVGTSRPETQLFRFFPIPSGSLGIGKNLKS